MIRRSGRTAIGSLVLLATILLAAVPCWAGWTARTLMGQTSSTSYQCMTAAAVGPSGDAVAAWIDEPSGLAYAAVRRAGAWGASKPIYTVPLNAPEQIIEVRVAIGGDGTAVAAFVLSHFDRYAAYQVVMGAAMVPGATAWGPATEISARGPVGSLMLAADAAGNALALWSNAGTIMSAGRPSGGVWAPPQPVPGCPRVDGFAMSAAGAAAIAWSEMNGASFSVRAMSRPAGGSWSAPTDIAALAGPAYGVRVAIDGQGLAATAWQATSGYGYQVWMAREATPGAWDAPLALSDSAVSVYAIDFGMDAAGDMAVGWSEYDALTGEFRIRAQMRAAAGTVTEQSWPTTDVGIGMVAPPSVAISPDGSLVTVAWIDDGLGQAYAATFTPTLQWSQPALIGLALYENTIALACGPQASACAVWPTRSPLAPEFVIGFRASVFTLVHAVPVLKSLSPWMAQRGLGPVDISAVGANFLLGAGGTFVQWDGADRPTDPISGSNVIGHLTAADMSSEGVHRITVRNIAPGGGVSKSGPFIVDGTAPTTTIALTGKLGQNGWYNGAVQAKVTAVDSLTGIRAITYMTDALAPVARTFATATTLTNLTLPKTIAFTVSGDRVHTVRFTSADNVLNADVVRAVDVKIDATAPGISASVKPSVLPAKDAATAVTVISGLIADVTSGVDPASVGYAVVDEYGVCQPSGAIALTATGAYSIALSLDTHRDVTDLTGRTYSITIAARNQAGLLRSKTVTVTVK